MGNEWKQMKQDEFFLLLFHWIRNCCSKRNTEDPVDGPNQVETGGRFKKEPTRTYPNFLWVKQCHTPPSRLGIVTIPPIVICGMVYYCFTHITP